MENNIKNRNKKLKKELKNKYAKKIIIYGAPAHMLTGNGKLIYNMAKAFKEGGHTVFTIGIEYNRPQINYEGWLPILPGFHCENCGNSTKGNIENVSKIAEYVNYLQPDFFICVGDPYQMQQFGIGNLEFEKMKHTKAIMYATIDSEGLFCNDMLTKIGGLRDYIHICDKIVSTSNYTKEQFKKLLNIDTEVIHEVVNGKTYSKIPSIKKIELRKKYRFPEDSFIMYYSGRNIMRKKHDILIEAAAKFISETNNTYLYLNIPPSFTSEDGSLIFPDELNPIDFVKRVLKNKFGRDLMDEGRIIFISRQGLGSKGITEEQNAEFYQLSDVYLTSTGGEGFGLVPIEANLCGIPVIVPDNSTAQETIGIDEDGDGIGGIIIDTPNENWVGFGLKQYHTTPHLMYDAINKIYYNTDLRKKLGNNGRKYSLKMFNFELFKSKWLNFIKKTEKKVIKDIKEEFKTLELGI